MPLGKHAYGGALGVLLAALAPLGCGGVTEGLAGPFSAYHSFDDLTKLETDTALISRDDDFVIQCVKAGVTTGDVIGAQLYQGSAPVQFARQTYTATRDGDVGIAFDFDRFDSRDWVSGSYRVDATLGGVLFGSLTFAIQ